MKPTFKVRELVQLNVALTTLLRYKQHILLHKPWNPYVEYTPLVIAGVEMSVQCGLCHFLADWDYVHEDGYTHATFSKLLVYCGFVTDSGAPSPYPVGTGDEYNIIKAKWQGEYGERRWQFVRNMQEQVWRLLQEHNAPLSSNVCVTEWNAK